MQDAPANEPNWGGYDFTSGSPTLWNQAASGQSFDPQAARDALDYSNVRMSGCEDRIHDPTPDIYRTGPFTSTDLQDMGFTTSPSDQTTQSTPRRYSSSVRRKVQTNPPSLTLQMEKVCPLLAGQVSQCIPQRCGPDAACLEFSGLVDLEDCASGPCDADKLTKRPEFSPSSQLLQVSAVDTVPARPSTSLSKKQSTSSRPRQQRGNRDDTNARSHSKKAHSLVERRYRENLNGSIARLHLTLMKTKRVGGQLPASQHEDSEEQQSDMSKMCKSDIMLEAVAYVHQTEVELRHMADEIDLLTSRVRQFEKLVKCEDCVLMKQLVSCNL
jgi:Helix-loop-helix DNA-binding domain